MYIVYYQDRERMKVYEIEVPNREDADLEALALQDQGFDNIIIEEIK